LESYDPPTIKYLNNFILKHLYVLKLKPKVKFRHVKKIQRKLNIQF